MQNGTLLTAFALSQAEKQAIEQRFTQFLNEPVALVEKVDESLIGGVCVLIGGRMYDGSLRASLADVGKFLVSSKEEESAHA